MIKAQFRNSVIVLILVIVISLKCIAQKNEPENLKVFDNWVEWSNGRNMLQLYLNRQAYSLLDNRVKAISALKTESDWTDRQKRIKIILAEMVGKFPAKSPLNPRITGTIIRENFRVEKVVFESVPDFHVTGCLFIPAGAKGKLPAVLNVIGHTQESFRNDMYQKIILNLVEKGFIVFAIDPVGQGERLQYADAGSGQLQAAGPTGEHTVMANQCLLAGYSLSKYFIWDGIRAIDYLLSRPEVDPERIGLTGLSGGGTQTAFIAAFDERIKAAAPTCYITGYRRLLESIGPQDGEQNFYHGLLKGIDHADLLEVRAPKPTLLVSTTRDFFSIQGTREVFTETRKTWQAFGKEGNIRMTEDDNGHGFIKKNDEATYAFFQKELSVPGNPEEKEVNYFSGNELNVTPEGQVLTSYKGKTIFDLNKPVVKKLVSDLELSRKNNPEHLEIIRQKARILSGFEEPEDNESSVFRGRYQRDGYAVELYALQGNRNPVIPLLVMLPDKESQRVLVYIHPEGKDDEAKPGAQIGALVKQGFIVVAPDLSGTGETRPAQAYPGAVSYEAQLIGRSIVGIQAGDIARVLKFIKFTRELKGKPVFMMARGEECPALLHAAAFEPSIAGIALVESPVSYTDIATTQLYAFSPSFSWGVAGALTGYDLPDLAASIAPRRFLYLNPVDGQKKAASENLINAQMAFPQSVYSKAGPGKLKIRVAGEQELPGILSDWFGNE